VLVETTGGRLLPAMTYIKPDGEKSAPAEDYVMRIVTTAREQGYPAWYLKRLEEFLPR
jgi:hypothetical protein